jgi:AAA family ATP:ADP antiporter
MPQDPAPSQLSWVERVLRVVTDVRAGEGPLALVLAANIFLLLTAYYVIKPVREALILAQEAGAEYKSYMSAVIAVALLGLVPAYGKLVDRLPRLKLVVGVTLFFASHLVIFFLVSQFEGLRSNLGLIFYFWVGIFNMMVVAQLWSFANDLYTSEQGKRLFPLVALGASLGAALGSKVADWLVDSVGVYGLLLVAAGLLLACAGLFVLAERLAVALRERTGTDAPASSKPVSERQAAESKAGGFGLVLKSPYLLAVALLALILNFANSNGEYMLGKLVKAAATDAVAQGTLAPDQIGTFIGHAYADFFFYVNVLGVFMQAFVVSRVVKHAGLGTALLVLPLISLSLGVATLILPVLLIVQIGKTLENATDYSLNNTARQMLWLPTSPATKYKAKQAVDTFFVRLGDVSAALLVYVGASLFDWPVRGFAVANVVLGALWVVLAVRIIAQHRKLEEAKQQRGSAEV